MGRPRIALIRAGVSSAHDAGETPALRDRTDTETASYDADVQLPKHIDRDYRYRSSLTTPLLTENTEWSVIADPAALSTAEIRLGVRRRHDAGWQVRHPCAPLAADSQA